jgi:hypothetical protein
LALRHNYLIISAFSILISILMASCANPIAPEGGAKDLTPPKQILFDHPFQAGKT